MAEYSVISEIVAAHRIVANVSRGRFVPWLGAGASCEAGIPPAQRLAQEIEDGLISLHVQENQGKAPLTDDERAALLKRLCPCTDRDHRYSETMKRGYPGLRERVEFFRNLTQGAQPSFVHYATAQLVRDGFLAKTCITTNFDKLIEHAFVEVGGIDCQAIRIESDTPFYKRDDGKAYCLKIHGDCDTHSLCNTPEETVQVKDAMKTAVRAALRDRGAVVIGLSGSEKSVHTFFDELTSDTSQRDSMLAFGLLWGVYVGEDVPAGAEPEQLVRAALEAGVVSKEIVNLMIRMKSAPNTFAFFPMRGSGSFFKTVIQASGNEYVKRSSLPYLDHELRIRETFRQQNIGHEVIERHLQKLESIRQRLKAPNDRLSAPPQHLQTRRVADTELEICLSAGAITSDQLLLGFRRSDRGPSAVISPEDTCLSVGGGAALALAQAAGPRQIIYDLSKLAPVSLGDVVVTTAGRLPAEYILHAASTQLSEKKDGLTTTHETIKAAYRDALDKARVLRIHTLFTPLLGTGSGGRSIEDSLTALLEAVRSVGPEHLNLKLIIVDFERKIALQEFDQLYNRVLAPNA
jgi:O-acetyl-ADP-ribose deacetylase (regulator of RNase III)/NAD-dependent SIR2 family protein deacetylase